MAVHSQISGDIGAETGACQAILVAPDCGERDLDLLGGIVVIVLEDHVFVVRADEQQAGDGLVRELAGELRCHKIFYHLDGHIIQLGLQDADALQKARQGALQTQLVLRHERCARGFVHARLERDEEFLFVVAVHAGVRGVHVRAAARAGLQKYRTVEQLFAQLRLRLCVDDVVLLDVKGGAALGAGHLRGVRRGHETIPPVQKK